MVGINIEEYPLVRWVPLLLGYIPLDHDQIIVKRYKTDASRWLYIEITLIWL